MTRRILHCPECGRRYHVDEQQLARRELLVLCGNCGSSFTPQPEQLTAESPAAGGESGDSVLVAHESPSVCNNVGRVVRESGYVPRYVHSGSAALAAFDDTLLDVPKALVLDVGIPDVFAFEVVAALRHRPALANLPIVLLASVFDPTSYKRRPSSLHGATAYLELHHVPDRLPVLLREHLRGDPAGSPYRGHLPGEYARAEAIRVGTTAIGSDRALAVARRIVSDIALYSERDILDALATDGGSLRLEEIFAAGRKVYDEMMAGVDGIAGKPYDVAVQALCDSMRRRSSRS